MRHRKNRDISIFSMSALDLFACALGAFFLLMIVLFPYYKKETDTKQKLATALKAAESCKADNEAARREQQDAARQRDEALRERDEARQQNQQCVQQLGAGILLATVAWEHFDKSITDANDIDLYVFDPEGKRYTFETPTHPGTQARLSLDTKATPGFEVFEDPVIREGTYRFFLMLYPKTAVGDRPITVRVRLYTRAGGQDAPVRQINPAVDAGKMMEIGSITISSTGEPSVQFTR